MSKLLTILAASLVCVGAGVGGYVYYTDALSGSTSRFGPTASSDDGGCPLCEQARVKRSCCTGEADAKKLALGGKCEISGAGCCEDAGDLATSKTSAGDPTAALIGGSLYARSTRKISCCEDEGDNALAGLVGTALTVAKK